MPRLQELNLTTLRPTRREVMSTALAAGVLPMLAGRSTAQTATGAPVPFSLDILRDTARQLAQQPYQPTVAGDAELLESIDYDLHNQITFRDDHTLWGDVPGAAKVRFFHPGRYFKEPVQINVVEAGVARELAFSTDMFEMPDGHPARGLRDAGFAGFRVMDPDATNDWLAVLGASYFRTSGYSGQFGLSARGLAIDSGGPGPEEFPRFSRFWLEQGSAGGIVIYALLESPRTTGAYRLATSRIEEEGIFQEIDATIFVRGDIDRLGIAPLTSMFWFGKNNRFIGPDWRPEVHDSDGLEMHLGNGERIWRPLNNPPQVTANTFGADGVRGFGLAQRERSFEEFQDDGVFYEKRATAWIEPRGDWGAGSVMLVELPTNDEIHDNIVAFWNPAEPAVAGSEYDLGYKLSWVKDTPPVRGRELHRHPARRRRRSRPAATGQRGEVRLRSGRQGPRRPGPHQRRRGDRRGEPRQPRPRVRLPDRHHRPVARDLRPRHRPARSGGRADRPPDVREPRGQGDVGDLDLPGVSVAAARHAGRSAPDRRPEAGGRARHAELIRAPVDSSGRRKRSPNRRWRRIASRRVVGRSARARRPRGDGHHRRLAIRARLPGRVRRYRACQGAGRRARICRRTNPRSACRAVVSDVGP